jgi:hypothetical protein
MTPAQFIEGLLRQFKAQAQQEDQTELLAAEYCEAIEEEKFSEAVIDRAYKTILRQHLSLWLPKVAEVLRYCQDAKDAEAWKQQKRGDPDPATGQSGIERDSGGSISTTVAFTRKIHRACGKTENAEKFKFVWQIVKENHSRLSLAKLEVRLLAAARFLSRGIGPREAVEMAFAEEAGEGARKVGGDPWSDERVEEADDLIQSDLGRQAAQEGWIIALHDYCRENRELPGVDRAAKIRASAFKRAAQREEWSHLGRASLVLAPVVRAMTKKRDRLTHIAMEAS